VNIPRGKKGGNFDDLFGKTIIKMPHSFGVAGHFHKIGEETFLQIFLL